MNGLYVVQFPHQHNRDDDDDDDEAFKSSLQTHMQSFPKGNESASLRVSEHIMICNSEVVTLCL